MRKGPRSCVAGGQPVCQPILERPIGHQVPLAGARLGEDGHRGHVPSFGVRVVVHHSPELVRGGSSLRFSQKAERPYPNRARIPPERWRDGTGGQLAVVGTPCHLDITTRQVARVVRIRQQVGCDGRRSRIGDLPIEPDLVSNAHHRVRRPFDHLDPWRAQDAEVLARFIGNQGRIPRPSFDVRAVDGE